jgi:large subunit ribosomal protein L18e
MISKTKIEKKLKRKTNTELVQSIIISKKNKGWLRTAQMISTPRRKRLSVNLEEINQVAKDGEIIIIPGKVLSMGEIDKKIKICALGFSQIALDKLKKSKTEICTIADEIKKNPEAKNIHLIEENIEVKR